MSQIRDQISAELKAAMKSGDKVRLGTVRLIKSKVLEAETAKGAGEVDEAGLIALLQTMKKQRLESIDQYEKGGREDLVEKERNEIAVIETFLPAQLDDAGLATLIDEVVTELGADSMKDMGRVMKEAKSRVAGRAEGRRVADAVKQRLS